MARYIPQRNDAGVIIGMHPDNKAPQVVTLVEETMKAVGATSIPEQPIKQTTKQSYPLPDKRTTGAFIAVAVLLVIMLFDIAREVQVKPGVYPTAKLPPPTQFQPASAATRAPPTLTQTEEPVPTPAPEVELSSLPELEQPTLAVFEPSTPSEAPAPQVDAQATADKQATVEAWLQNEPSTATPLPQPGEPGFKESFQPPPECNPFIGYVGPKRVQCEAVYEAQTAQAQP